MAITTKGLDQILVDEHVLTREQVEAALKDQQEKGGSLGAAAGRLGFCAEDAVARLIATIRGTKYVDLTAAKPEAMDQFAKLVPGELAHKYKAILVGKFRDKFTFAVVDPAEPALIRLSDDFFRGRPGQQVEFVVTTESMIAAALEKYFPGGGKKAPPAPGKPSGAQTASLDAAAGEIGAIQVAEGPDGSGPPIDIEVVQEAQDTEGDTEVDEKPIIQFVNKIIFDAVEQKASDIHLDPNEQGVMLRYRKDGVLHDITQIPAKWKRAIAAIVKVKTKQMKIEERRRPQDAKIKIKVPSREKPVDLRVSTLPVVWGEKIVMRILDTSRLFGLNELGMEPDVLAKLEKAISQPQGMIIITGPTGSGKTNTLYSALNTVNVRTRNIMTAENPVEFQLPGINQVQINAEAGMTFPAALKAFLRQDPNIILVGEVRDFEEVDIAVKAAMTGHLVLTTLHTNDAPSTITRLLDMADSTGNHVDPGIISTAVNIIIAQRLMRTICKECKEPTTYPEEMYHRLGMDAKDFEGVALMKGKGCDKCGKSGYKGRTGIYEAILMSRALRDMVMARKDANALRDQAIKEGMRTLRESALAKAKAGVSTLEEVIEATVEM